VMTEEVRGRRVKGWKASTGSWRGRDVDVPMGVRQMIVIASGGIIRGSCIVLVSIFLEEWMERHIGK
jgi:hypothetical protein